MVRVTPKSRWILSDAALPHGPGSEGTCHDVYDAY